MPLLPFLPFLLCAVFMFGYGIFMVLENSRLRKEVGRLKYRISVLDSLVKEEEQEDEDEDKDVVWVGRLVEIKLGEVYVQGRLESVATPSCDNPSKPGFVFRAIGDKKSLWLSHDVPVYVCKEDEGEEATSKATNKWCN